MRKLLLGGHAKFIIFSTPLSFFLLIPSLLSDNFCSQRCRGQFELLFHSLMIMHDKKNHKVEVVHSVEDADE